MSGETEKDVSGWTTDTLRSVILQMLADRDALADERHLSVLAALKLAIEQQDKLTQLALEAADHAVTKAEIATEKRFESVNEFRATLSDQTASFMTRAEVQANSDTLREKIELNQKALSSLMPREEMNAIIKGTTDQSTTRYEALVKKNDDMQARLDRIEGGRDGIKSGWIYLAGGITLLATIVSVALAVLRAVKP